MTEEKPDSETIQEPMDAKFASLDMINGEVLFRYDDNYSFEGILLKTNGKQVTNGNFESSKKILADLNSVFSEKDSTNMDLIEEIRSLIKKFVHLEDDREYTILSLFIILSYAVRLFDRIPYLHLTGKKGSGKTTLMLVLKSLTHNPSMFTNMTAATMFRLIDSSKPTLFIDEADGLKSTNSVNTPIFQILNSGYQKNGIVPRTIGRRVVEFSTYCMKIIGGIEDLHPTTLDRCITIKMQKITADTSKLISPFDSSSDYGQGVIIENILRILGIKQNDVVSILSDPTSLAINDKIYGRDYDKWFPLITLAKIFSLEGKDYTETVVNYALESIEKRTAEEEHNPENLCRSIISDFITTRRAKSVITGDKLHHYYLCTDIQDLIISQDPYNYYRNKGDITKILKSIGIVVVRRRINKSGPTSLYKIPRYL